MTKLFEDKIVLITGGTTGIGRATAVIMAAAGATVYIFGRHEDALNDALSDIRKITGFEASGFITDVTDLPKVATIFDAIRNRHGRLDFFINNAGIGSRSILNIDHKEIDYLINVDLTAYLHCAKMAIKLMTEGGHIINIGSMSAETADADTDAYSAAKAGVRTFSKSLRQSINKKNIKLTLIEPGSVGTDLINESVEEQIEAENADRLLKTEDIARSVLFALTQPKRVEIMTIQLKPFKQIF